jgi:2-polyprenyl-6-hydroxyphenyl methylase / 3-demethylubiquinone-9 3-methyltransferase
MIEIPKNVDPAEITKFDAAAAWWWDKNGRFKSLHDINPLRLDYIQQRVTLENKRVLDVGCGGGLLSESLAAAGADVTGIDMGEAPLEVARRHMSVSGLEVRYLRETAESFSIKNPNGFNVITCMELLEHVPDPPSVMSACAGLVKPGGDLFFATLNRNPKSYLFAIIGAEYLLGLVPRGTHEHYRFIKPDELAGWASDSGLLNRDMTGLHYNPFTRKYSVGGNLHVNYLAHFRKPG